MRWKIKKRKKKFRQQKVLKRLDNEPVKIRRTILSPRKQVIEEGLTYEIYRLGIGRKDCKTFMCKERVYGKGDYCFYCQKIQDGLTTRELEDRWWEEQEQAGSN